MAPEALPTEVLFRTATESFDESWDVALRDDRICLRERGVGDAPWVLLGETGRPEGPGLEGGPADRLVSISADGTQLQALDASGRFFRATDLRRASAPRTLRWTDRWG